MDLVEAVAPIQLGIRLLIPPGSRLLELEEVRDMVSPFDAKALIYPWKNPNAAIDRLCEELQDIVAASEKLKHGRAATFEKMWQAVSHAANLACEKPEATFAALTGHRAVSQRALVLLSGADAGPVGPHSESEGSGAPGGNIFVKGRRQTR